MHTHNRYSVQADICGVYILPYCLAVTPCSLLRPPPHYFREKLLYRVILPPLHAPPLEPVCGTAVIARVRVLQGRRSCIKCVENSLRTGLGLFCWSRTVSRLRPSSCRCGRWEESGCYVLRQHVRGQQLFHPSVLPRHVDRRSSRLLPHYRVRKFVGGRGGGLTVRWKRKSSLLRPPPLFFLEVGRKKGGHNSGAVRYMRGLHMYMRSPQIYLRRCMHMYMRPA